MRPTPIFSPRREVVAHEILEDDADVAAQLGEVVLAQVEAVEQDAPFGRVVEPRQQLDDGGLAGAVLADQRQLSPAWSVRFRSRTAQRSESG